MLKTPKFALILLWGGAFLASADNISKSPPHLIMSLMRVPPSDSVPYGDQKSSLQASPPQKKNL